MIETQKLIILRGLPGAGKSTWANAWREVDPHRREIVNRDQLRHHLFGQYAGLTAHQEDEVTDLQFQFADLALREAKSLAVDDTNLKRHYLIRWVTLADHHGVPYEILTIDTPLEECLRRNRQRAAAGGRFVPEHAIWHMYQTADPID